LLLAIFNGRIDAMAAAAPTASLPERIAAIRQFNRFYTRRIGVLHESLLDSSFTLTESRLLWELAHPANEAGVTASELARTLDLDAGYLSRLLRRFKERGLVKATRGRDDARQLHLVLTAAGRRAFAPLDERSQHEVQALIATLTEPQQQDLLRSLGQVQRLLDDAPPAAVQAGFLLRPHRPGDMGWVIARHGALYAREYHWDLGFEAMVARIAADFIERFDPRREACWIAERDGANVGSVCLVQAHDDASGAVLPGVAQLRLLLVEPATRGLGIGERLVAECTRFAQDAGYERIRLWTHSVLHAARALYKKAGYVLVASEPYRGFGHDMVGETWELALR
jgi:DNA-binding MarR family transcriptional regulator/GNAT superfamily N-acetyltransferase